jgi:hypothetical protein
MYRTGRLVLGPSRQRPRVREALRHRRQSGPPLATKVALSLPPKWPLFLAGKGLLS